MKFSEWLLTETKHLSNMSSECALCKSRLIGYTIVENPNHIYTTGILYNCNCKKSSIWTNSVRNEDNLIKFLKGESDRYYNGFCNDLFCGKCFNYVYPLKNGYPYQGHNLDLYGCKNCDNKNIVVDIRSNDPEGESTTKKFIEIYRRLLK